MVYGHKQLECFTVLGHVGERGEVAPVALADAEVGFVLRLVKIWVGLPRVCGLELGG